MLRGKNLVVTGCLSGIGRQTLVTFADNGANIFACTYKRTDEFEVCCDELREKNNVNIIPVYFDMTDIEAIKKAAVEIQSSKLDIHGLVNIAGINRDAYFGMVSMKDMEATFQVNFFSQIIFSQYVAKLMIRK